ncbi:MAG: hydrogen gas-evolving membrane-bound hydrogenase subunit E [Coriobacteriia bacterium]|nr:hydrogen gas-evolving membrane-bound hydrogenase subunit E [Coriobacteriia bacterium]
MKKLLVTALLIVAAVPLLFTAADLPQYGSAENATYTHVSAHYLEHAVEDAGAENIVTDVILNYRGFDTNGEVTVIFTALAAVLAVLLLDRTPATASEKPAQPTQPVSIVVSFIVRLLAPFIALFALYVILNGHATPGGGFQGGTILGALAIALTLVLGEKKAQRLLPEGLKPWLQATAPLTFVVIGLIGLVSVGSYLEFPTVDGNVASAVAAFFSNIGFPAAEGLSWVRAVWLVILEFGIGIGGAAVIASIFWTMEAE